MSTCTCPVAATAMCPVHGIRPKASDRLSDEHVAMLLDDRPGISYGYARSLAAGEVIDLAREVQDSRRLREAIRALPDTMPDDFALRAREVMPAVTTYLARDVWMVAMRQVKALLDGES